MAGQQKATIVLSNPTDDVSFSLTGVEILSAPTNLTSTGSVITFTPSDNATSYEVYAGDTLIGEATV